MRSHVGLVPLVGFSLVNEMPRSAFLRRMHDGGASLTRAFAAFDSREYRGRLGSHESNGRCLIDDPSRPTDDNRVKGAPDANDRR